MTLDPELDCQDLAPDRPPHCVVALDGPDGDAGPVVDCGPGDFNCADWPVALAVVGVSWDGATLFDFNLNFATHLLQMQRGRLCFLEGG